MPDSPTYDEQAKQFRDLFVNRRGKGGAAITELTETQRIRAALSFADLQAKLAASEEAVREYHEASEAVVGFWKKGYISALGYPNVRKALNALSDLPHPDGASAAVEAAKLRSALEQADCKCDVRIVETCPDCGAALEEVRQREPRMLNSEQYAASIAGNMFCTGACTSDAAPSGKKYFWLSRLPTYVFGELCYRCAALGERSSQEGEGSERCHAGRDGDCIWAECPQLVNYQSYCPIAKAAEARDAVAEEAQ